MMTLEKRKNLEWILDALSLGAVLQYAAYRFLQSTMFVLYYSNTYKMITMLLLIVFGGVRWLYLTAKKWKEKDGEGRERFLLYCLGAVVLAIPFFYVGWKHDYRLLIFLPICCMCLYDMQAEKILKAFAWTIGTLLAATVLCCLSGTVRNLVQTQGNKVVAAYGIINTTDFASYFTFLLLAVWCGMRRRAWYIEVLFSITATVVSYIVYLLTDSRTVISCGVLIALFSLWDTFNENVLRKRESHSGDKINRIAIIAFPLIGIAVLLLTISYSQQASWAVRVNDFLSGRLEDTLVPYQTYGIHSFGSLIETMHGKGGTILAGNWSSGYGYIDVAYAMLAIRYGWVITAIVTGLWVWMTVKALNNGNARIALTLAIIAFHAFSEARVWDVNYNIFLIMPFCILNPLAEKVGKSEKKLSASCIAAIALGAVLIFILPRVLSWARTFFSIKGWNNGIAAFNSLLICIGLIGFFVLLWHCLSRLIKEHNRRAVVQVALALVVGTAGVIVVNNEINGQLVAQAERLDEEEQAVHLVQQVASQPVYVAESQELYRRRYGGFTDHIFSTEELCGKKTGTIFTDASIEALGITTTGGVFTQVSDSTGVYTYDLGVMRALSGIGLEWTPYYNGTRYVKLVDTSVFNDRSTLLEVSGPTRIITTNTEIDQLSGNYNVTFELSRLKGSGKETLATLEVLGDAGDRQILQEEIYASDFDSEGQCSRKIEYTIGSTPKVSYAITVPENVTLNIDKISWRRVFQNHTKGVEKKTDGSIIMTTDVPDNKFNMVHFQLYNAATGVYVCEFGSESSIGEIAGNYVHNGSSGFYYIRLKGNTNLIDEWYQTMLYLENEATINYQYNIVEFSSKRIVISDIETTKE